MVVRHIQRRLQEKSEKHRQDLQKLGKLVMDEPLSPNVHLMDKTPQSLGMNTTLQNVDTEQVDFVFYFDRLATLLIEKCAPPLHSLPCISFNTIPNILTNLTIILQST
jgi:uridine kinase